MTERETILFAAVINNLGIKNQLAVATEELLELGKELTKGMRDKVNRMKVTEELADVLICVDQIKMMYGIRDKEIKIWREFKVKRLSYMIDRGDYK